MPHDRFGLLLSPWRESPRPPKLAAVFVVIGIICILLTTFFGVTEFSNWLLYSAQAFLALGVVVFAAYIIYGIISDARAL